jgi:hypothetical protein
MTGGKATEGGANGNCDSPGYEPVEAGKVHGAWIKDG